MASLERIFSYSGSDKLQRSQMSALALNETVKGT